MSNAFSFDYPDGKAPILSRMKDDDVAAPSIQKTATRADLLDAVSSACPNLSRHQAREIFEMMLEEVSESLSRGESVKIRSFGLFNVREKRERVGRNPRTGVEVPITPRRVLTFKPSPVLLDAVNGRIGAELEAAIAKD